MAAAAVISDPAPHYWSYKTLLEDKKRCLVDVGHVKHEFCNSLEKEGEDPKTSQRALAERKRHHRGDLNKSWHRGGAETPPHDYDRSGTPHFSQQEFQEKKQKMQTEIRKTSSRRSLEASAESRQASDCGSDDVGALLNHSKYDNTFGFGFEKAALADRRGSNEPHDSQRVLAMKKRHHATSVHSSSRGLQRSRSESPRSSYSDSWQASSSNRSGRYTSQASMNLDKRRHNAAIDGDSASEWARTRDLRQHAAEHHEYYDGDREIYKPDFLARGDKYRSQYALQQHKRRHLAEIHSGGDQHYDTESICHAGPYSGEGHRLGQSMSEKGLFTSQQALCFAKRGHIIDLKSAEGFARRRAQSARSDHSDSSSSCDVGKGISRMMHNHREDQVHNSYNEFSLKKKNHATSVHKAPKADDAASDCTSVSSRASFGMHALADTRRPSDPHHSCKAFALKKKYHVTPIHATNSSRLHPDNRRSRSVDLDPKSLSSHEHLNKMKKVHRFEANSASRSRQEPPPIRKAPAPRSGQWTPQHLD